MDYTFFFHDFMTKKELKNLYVQLFLLIYLYIYLYYIL